MSDNSPVGLDLEQQLDNVLAFITQPDKGSAPDKSTQSVENVLNKALYYLKNEQPPLAAKWMRLAAMAGNHRAQFYMGLFFIKGQGVPHSVFHGAVWLSLASSQGYEPATAALDDLRKHISTRRLHDAQSYAATLYEQIHQQQFAHLIPRDPDAS
ncbi:sel1 repeat family protein [Pseudoalteromonas shioyasakiensis]|jgi:TPR repeat protein|uniref:Sel1 repeat family protein n=2 Tax=Pseudoalteromonas TaxID=53246 RepID=A0ABU8SXR3_9GAMM|nr:MULTISPECIES: sel1 repeat family protein [Pseudoalteromonas]MCP4587787.1 sel1 repeat family protein [Pseudoalteromonas sp.]MCQ8882559.1 sel1 repeat family protein [Pseudoalteromonas shioyasakiensis]NIZ04822.1 sel1 repeat family protein [Pseudoalteromonas sp. HF66]QLE09744.1 sel1 repeat family protein [Pseudoalteromonas shioyasakiensis]QWV06269.1 sel1 repeat family protein [Pseudoalteromonas shioyasakiensis]|tara:strand:+ start:43 stop:507 length:465 start_codon:yes stop_codon:yes gene_type:complete